MQTVVIKVKKYKGANILIINEWYQFIAIIFYRGQFYTTKLDAIKRDHREYTATEYAQAADAMLQEAKLLVEAIRTKRSLRFKLKNLYNHYVRSQLQQERAG